MLGGAPVRWLGHVLLHHQAAGGDRGGLDVLRVGPDIADVGKGEGDDLAGIGWVGQGLLIARHAGVEADLADRRRRSGVGAEAATPEDRAVGQNQCRRGALRRVRPIGAGWRAGAENRRPARQVRQRETCGGDHSGPMTRWDRSGLAPLAHGLGPHAGETCRRVGAAQPVDDGLDGFGHGREPMGTDFPVQPQRAPREILSDSLHPPRFA